MYGNLLPGKLVVHTCWNVRKDMPNSRESAQPRNVCMTPSHRQACITSGTIIRSVAYTGNYLMSFSLLLAGTGLIPGKMLQITMFMELGVLYAAA